MGVWPENQNRAAQRRGSDSSGQTPHPPAMKGFLSTLIWFDCFVVQQKRRSINPYAEKGLNKRVWNTIQTLSRVQFSLATPWQRAWSVERIVLMLFVKPCNKCKTWIDSVLIHLFLISVNNMYMMYLINVHSILIFQNAEKCWKNLPTLTWSYPSRWVF